MFSLIIACIKCGLFILMCVFYSFDRNLTKITSMAQIDNERITQINVYNKLIQATSINSMFYEIF